MPSSTTPISPTIADQVSYISGVTGNGMVAPLTFKTWNGDDPATYNSTTSSASKWALGGPSAGSSAIGSAGGTQYYYFDPASSFTSAQRASLASGLKMWSAVANIQFAEVTAADAAATLRSRPSGSGRTPTAAPLSRGVVARLCRSAQRCWIIRVRAPT